MLKIDEITLDNRLSQNRDDCTPYNTCGPFVGAPSCGPDVGNGNCGPDYGDCLPES